MSDSPTTSTATTASSTASSTTSDAFDAVVLGIGSGGEVVAEKLAEAGWSVAAVEAERVGGACPYVSCVPSKAMLLAARQHRADRAGAEGDPADHEQAWQDAVRRRDEAAENRDDSGAASSQTDAGVTLVRGRGRVTEHRPDGPGGTVTVRTADGERTLTWGRALVLATGSEPAPPPIDGLDEVPTWTSAEALSSTERPDRLVVLGGGAVGCELTQVYASFGVRVTLVETQDQLVPGEPGWAAGIMADALRAGGADVRLGVKAEQVEPLDGGGLRLHLSDGATVEADRLLIGTGRRPRTADLGLDVLGLDLSDGDPIPVDGRLRVQTSRAVLDDVFAVGDVTGIAPYTHTATYHGRLVVAQLQGRGRDADHSAVPRVVYTDPTMFSVGLTGTAAAEREGEVRTTTFDVTQTGRVFIEQTAGTLPEDAVAQVELYCTGSGVVLGACAVGPHADTWASELALAVRAQLTVGLLADHVHAFPTWEEALQPPAQELAGEVG